MVIDQEPEKEAAEADAVKHLLLHPSKVYNSHNFQQGNIPKPNKLLFDMNSPIYKKGDPTQAGELGKVN
jgi:hypothetical protein